LLSKGVGLRAWDVDGKYSILCTTVMSKFPLAPLFPRTNKYLHIGQINFIKTRIKFCNVAKKGESFNQKRFAVLRKLFNKKNH
jgi:hypothetical protein